MKVILTGATGFVGEDALRACISLAEQGYGSRILTPKDLRKLGKNQK
ncbi:MAG: hypothetical protein IJ196_08255 [Prevotella sp.]|nr:hypothetical protein [Prevotella sp.]